MNEDSLRECKESFDGFDTGLTGRLDGKKIKELINSFGIMASDEEINNGGGSNGVPYDTFLRFYTEKMQEPKNDNGEEAFAGGVSKKTGKLSKKKFKMALMNFGGKFTEKETEDVGNEFKIDGEGNIDYKAFIKSMKSQ